MKEVDFNFRKFHKQWRRLQYKYQRPGKVGTVWVTSELVYVLPLSQKACKIFQYANTQGGRRRISAACPAGASHGSSGDGALALASAL